VVSAVKKEGLSRHRAAARFGVAISTAINWVKRFDERGSAAPDKMGGHKPKKIAGGHADWLRERCHEKPFTLQGLVRELADERDLKADYRSGWEFVHAEKLSYKKDVGCQRAGRPGLSGISCAGGRLNITPPWL
jgi:putative transposase